MSSIWSRSHSLESPSPSVQHRHSYEQLRAEGQDELGAQHPRPGNLGARTSPSEVGSDRRMQAAPRGSPDALTRSSARSPRTPAWNPRDPAECAVHQGTASSRGRGTRCWLCVLHPQGLFGSPSEAFIAKRMTNKLDETFEMQQSLGACPAAPGDEANADASEVDPAPLGLHLLGGTPSRGVQATETSS